MRGRLLTLIFIFACALLSGTAVALDGAGSGTLEEKITIKGCETGLESGQVTDFSIGTLGAWSLSTTEAGYAGNYTLKRVKKKKKRGYAFNLEFDGPGYDALIEAIGETTNQLCGLAPDTLVITEARVDKFLAKLSRDRTAVTLKVLIAATATNGSVTYKPKYNMLANIDFTSTGGGIGGKITGKVLAPDGQIAALEPPGLLTSLADFLLPPSNAAVSGLMKVPNRTSVELVHLSVAGTVDGVLATTKVYKGKYGFNLDQLGHFDAPDLAVRVSDRGVQMRAFLTSPTVDISPVSEAVVQLVSDRIMAVPGTLLANFTFDELDDLAASIDLLTSLKALPAVPGIDATVAAIKDLVAQDAGITEFLVAATDAGRTDVGPGDIGNLFPLSEGNTWVYGVTSSEHRDSYTEQTTVTGSMDINGTTVMVLNYAYPLGPENPYDEYLEESSTSLYNWGNTIPDDYITPVIAPYQQEVFPLKLDTSIEVANLAGQEWAEDLDGDGLYERFDVIATINTWGIESVSVPAGSFPLAVKQEIAAKVDVTLSRNGKHVKANEKITQWLASDIGPVKVNYKITVRAFGKTSTSTSTSLLESYRVDGQSGGNLPVTTYGCANTDTSCTLRELFDGGYFEVDFLRFDNWTFVSSSYTTPAAPDPSLMDVEIYDSAYLDSYQGLQGEGPGFRVIDEAHIFGSEHRDFRYAFQVSTLDGNHAINGNTLLMDSLSYGGGNAEIAGGLLEVNERVTDNQSMELATKKISAEVNGAENFNDFAGFATQSTILVETVFLEEGSPLNDEFAQINLQSYWQRFGYTAAPVPPTF